MHNGSYFMMQIAERMHASGYLEAVLRFGSWMAARKTPTNFRDVMGAFPVNRATSFRWINAWRAANGLPSISEEKRLHIKRKRKP